MALSPSVRARVSRAIGDEWKGMSWQERLDACAGARRSAVSMKTAAPKAKGEQKKRSRPSVVPFVHDESDAPTKKQAKEPMADQMQHGLQSADVSRVLSTLCVVESRLHARDVKANMSVIEKMGVSLATFEELQKHEDDRVYEEAARLLDNYFEVETSTPDME